ncbi:MAG: gliding motility-associated C-terminal domain-containing protein [Bacteroidota bacterium]
MITKSNTVFSNGYYFHSRGNHVIPDAGNDGAGGGGAGGSLIFYISNFLDVPNVSCTGGNGGSASNSTTPIIPHGPGGGGAGGVAFFSGSPTPAALIADLSGGQNGFFNDTNPHGAMPGQPGGIVDGQTLPFAQTPFVPLHWTDVGVSSGCDGSYELSLSAGGSEQGFEFSIDGNIWQGDGLFQYVPPGEHLLSVRTTCAELDTLVQLAQVDTLSLNVSLQDIDCDSPNGQAAAVALGGTTPYQFQLNGSTWQNGGLFSNLPQGDYLLSVQDAAGCIASGMFIIQNLVVPIDTVFNTDFTCHPASAGTTCTTFTTVSGCDSTVCLTFQFASLDTTALPVATTCDPSMAGVFCQILTTAAGCDSIVCQTWLLLPIADTTFLNGTTCDPASAGTSCQTFNGVDGCDSVACLSLEFVALATVWLPTSTTCEPSQTGTFCVQWQTPGGCDSTVCEAVNFAAPLVSVYDDTTCDPALAGSDTLLFGCDSIVIFQTAFLEFTASALPGNLTLPAGGSVGISLSLQPPGVAPASVLWSPAAGLSCDTCLSAVAQPSETTVYQALVASAEGCTASASLRIEVLKQVEVFVPNVFSPNEDGFNDLLTVFGGNEVARVVSLRIFDRWGELVFEAQDLSPSDVSGGWDGTFRGEKLDAAVFVWFAEVEFVDGRKAVFEGEVTLLK